MEDEIKTLGAHNNGNKPYYIEWPGVMSVDVFDTESIYRFQDGVWKLTKVYRRKPRVIEGHVKVQSGIMAFDKIGGIKDGY